MGCLLGTIQQGRKMGGLSFGNFREVFKGRFDGRTVIEENGVCDGDVTGRGVGGGRI